MQQLNPAEISNLIKQRIQDLDAGATAKNEGTIVKVSDGIVQIHGLEDAMYGEMIEFEGEIYGMALNLERDSVGAVVLGDYLKLQEGQKAYCTGRILEVPVGPELLGRVVDALGNPIDGKGPIDAKMTDKVEKIAPGVIDRQSVDQPVMTGYKAVDTMIQLVVVSVSLSLVTVRRVKPRWLSMRSSRRNHLVSSVYTSQSVRNVLPLQTSYASLSKLVH